MAGRVEPSASGAKPRQYGRSHSARGFLAALEPVIGRAAHDTGIGRLGVADLARLVDLVVSQAKVGCRGLKTLAAFKTFRPPFGHFAPRLRLIIFADQTPLCSSLDLERVSLRTVSSNDQIVTGRPWRGAPAAGGLNHSNKIPPDVGVQCMWDERHGSGEHRRSLQRCPCPGQC